MCTYIYICIYIYIEVINCYTIDWDELYTLHIIAVIFYELKRLRERAGLAFIGHISQKGSRATDF